MIISSNNFARKSFTETNDFARKSFTKASGLARKSFTKGTTTNPWGGVNTASGYYGIGEFGMDVYGGFTHFLGRNRPSITH